MSSMRVGKFNGKRAKPIKVIMSSLCDKYIILSKKHLLRGSRFFLEEDLTVKQEEEIRDEILKDRAARDEVKRAWIYKGKVVIARFGPPSKQSSKMVIKKRQQTLQQEIRKQGQYGKAGTKTQM